MMTMARGGVHGAALDGQGEQGTQRGEGGRGVSPHIVPIVLTHKLVPPLIAALRHDYSFCNYVRTDPIHVQENVLLGG